MPNVKIWGRNLVQNPSTDNPVVVTAGSEAPSMPVTNLQSSMPTEPYRSLNANDPTAWIRIDLGADWSPYDAVGLLYTSIYPHKNMLRFTRTMADWVHTNLSVATNLFDGSVPFGVAQGWTLSAVNGNHDLERTASIPNQIQSNFNDDRAYVMSVYFYAGAEEGNLNLRMKLTVGSSTVFGDYESVVGGPYTVNSVGETGSQFSNVSGSVEQAGDNFWRLILSFDKNQNSGAIDAEFFVLDSSFNDSFLGAGETVYITSPMVEHGPKATGFDTDNDLGYPSPLGRIEIGQSGFGSDVVVDDGALEFFRRSNELQLYGETMGFTHVLWDADFSISDESTTKFGRFIEMTWWSDGNVSPSEFVDFGLAYVGKSFQPVGNLEQGSLRVRFEENTDDIETDDHTYREQNKRRRILSFDLSTMTEAEAWQDAFNIQMLSGRSRPVLVDLEGGATGDYGQQRLIYGYLDDLGPVHHRYREKYGHSYQIREVLP